MKLRTPQHTQEARQAAEAPGVCSGVVLTAASAATRMDIALPVAVEPCAAELAEVFPVASGAVAVKDYDAAKGYYSGRSASWTMLDSRQFPSFDEWFKKVGGLKGLSGEWGSTWEESYSQWAEEEFSGLKSGPRKSQLVKQFMAEKAEDGIREMYWERTRVLESLVFPLEVYRSVDLPGEHALRTDKAGIFWTHLEEKAESYWGTEGGTPYILKGVVLEDSVDWIETLMRHLDPCLAGEEEEEIRLKEGAVIRIVGIRQADSQQWAPLITDATA